MTQKEIDAAKESLPRELLIHEWTEDQVRLRNELACREMINSCLVYEGIDGFWKECEWRYGDKSYAAPYIRSLGEQRVKELVAEQEKDFAVATVCHNVYEDSEGLTYNSIKWADD